MNVERLRHMQNILRQPLPPTVAFDLGIWCGPYSKWSNTEREATPAEPVPECGTVCCAIGLAMEDPIFQAQGFTKVAVSEQEVRQVSNANSHVPGFNGMTDYNAVASFFSLTNGEAVKLFGFYSYYYLGDGKRPTRQDVIDRIDNYIAAVNA